MGINSPTITYFTGRATVPPDPPAGGACGPQTSRSRIWGAAAPQTFLPPGTSRETGGLRSPDPPRINQKNFKKNKKSKNSTKSIKTHQASTQFGPELVSEALVVIFGIYAKNAVEWWYREPLGRSVSLFPSTSVNSEC